MNNLHHYRPDDDAMDSLSWPLKKSDEQLLPPSTQHRPVWELPAVQPLTGDDAALEVLRESDPEAYRMVVYSWA